LKGPDHMTTRIRPKRIRLEACARCQLGCPSCPNANKKTVGTLGNGHLDPENFRTLLDKSPFVREVELANCGEIFLNPELAAIIQDAFHRGVALTANSGTNLNHVDEKVLEAMVRGKFRSITCSIDGATQEVYSSYRRRGNLEVVLDNIRKLNAFKLKHGSKLPLLTWQYIVFGHNEHEISSARRLAEELDMTFRLKVAWADGFSPVQDRDLVEEEHWRNASARPEDKEIAPDRAMRIFCHQLWEDPQINWDGRVLGCCCNHWGDFGANAFTEGVFSAVNSDRIRYAREMLFGRVVPQEGIPCTTCSAYKYMQQTGDWLQRGVKRALYRTARYIYRDLGADQLVQRSRRVLSFGRD